MYDMHSICLLAFECAAFRSQLSQVFWVSFGLSSLYFFCDVFVLFFCSFWSRFGVPFGVVLGVKH